MKYLIIGSKGFIGTHLLNHLRENGFMAFGCDVVADYLDKYYFHFDNVDTGFDEIFQKELFDVCINCSGSASVPFSLTHPSSDFQLNVGNVFAMLDAIRKINPDCQFIQLSSAAVYGNPSELPVKEAHFLQPLSVYGFHKKVAEDLCSEFHKIFGLKIAIARIFSTYGEGLRKQLFWDLYQKSLGSKEVNLFGTGNETRDFIYIKDLVNALTLIVQKGEFTNEIYNLASGNQITIDYAANTFFRFYRSKVKVNFNGHIREGDPQQWKADISKIQKLGFKSEFSFEDGLKRYVEWLSL